MTRSEFIEGINLCSDWIADNGYTCDSIMYGFKFWVHIQADFRKRFKPHDAVPCSGIWFGDRYNFKNQCDRFFALMLFKEIALSEKLYERY
jgi:hypothetical protein